MDARLYMLGKPLGPRFKAKVAAEMKKDRCDFIREQDVTEILTRKVEDLQGASVDCEIANAEVELGFVIRLHKSGWPCISFSGYNFRQQQFAGSALYGTSTSGNAVQVTAKTTKERRAAVLEGENATSKHNSVFGSSVLVVSAHNCTTPYERERI